ncbi:uncharacterized protein LOC115878626 [Sitophilus oryzae]|uniref:Uncharacterized protein LOC115878626 n=1 Tax=Sitophilus oryzae TaxID=7048 RepID=A0A6J2XIA5_SITOR|nr:uncharacterized protein LOC115878626 [Sitophilus oryzae]
MDSKLSWKRNTEEKGDKENSMLFLVIAWCVGILQSHAESCKIRDLRKKKYDEGDITKALQAIAEGSSERKAAVQFRVPRSTLQFRSSGKFNNKTTPGPAPVLSHEEENIVKDWIKTSQTKGFPLHVEDVQLSVKQFLDENPRPNVPFLGNKPGRGWFRAFLRRHPDITLRTPEAITAASSNVSESDIRKWFTDIETYLVEKGYDSILQDPSRVFNGDETCFLLCPQNKRVLAARGSRNVYQIEHNSKFSLTVMFTFSAAGEVTPPMIIFPYKRIPAQVSNSVPGEWGVGCSDNGWMKNENFYEYIGNVLYKSLVEKGTTFPIILFVDGHVTHLTYQTSQLCSRLGIILIALYPNSTRIMQPADVSAFKPLKVYWSKAVQKFHRDYPKSVVTKENFAPIKIIKLEDIPIVLEEELNGKIVPNVVMDVIPSSTSNISSIDNLDVIADTEKPTCSFELSEANTSLSKYFFWPKTPERKGKRQNEKLPFVLTSTVRKNVEKAKIERKEYELKEKTRRKEERIKKQNLKKESKENMIKKTTMKKKSKIVKKDKNVNKPFLEENITNNNFVEEQNKIDSCSSSQIPVILKNLDSKGKIKENSINPIKETLTKNRVRIHLPENSSSAKKKKSSEGLKCK